MIKLNSMIISISMISIIIMLGSSSTRARARFYSISLDTWYVENTYEVNFESEKTDVSNCQVLNRDSAGVRANITGSVASVA